MATEDVRAPRGPALALVTSLLLHGLCFVLALWVSTEPRDLAARQADAEAKPPVEVTFVTPPQPRPPPPAEPRAAATPPPESPPRQPRDRAESSSPPVAADERERPGSAAGPLPDPTPGAEEGNDAPAIAGSTLGARLREFDRSLADKDLEAPRAPKGGGLGLGGLDLRNLPESGFGVGNLEFETRAYDWTDYGRQVYWIIWRAWHNRLYLTTDNFEKWAWERGWALDHRSRVRFTIEASGQIGDIVLETPSGCLPLDQSALDALSEAVLPPLPKDFPKQREVVHARFLAEGDIRNMRPTLHYLKGKGYF